MNDILPDVVGGGNVIREAMPVVGFDTAGNPTAGPGAAYSNGTREHTTSTISRRAIGATTAAFALPAVGPSREIYVMANTRCFFKTGTSTVTAAPGDSHPLAVDERFYFRVPDGHTHIAVIRDGSDGNITICAVK